MLSIWDNWSTNWYSIEFEHAQIERSNLDFFSSFNNEVRKWNIVYFSNAGFN